MQLRSMVRRKGGEGNEIRGGRSRLSEGSIGGLGVGMGLTQLFKFFLRSAQTRPALIGRRNKVTIDLDVREVSKEFLETLPRLAL